MALGMGLLTGGCGAGKQSDVDVDLTKMSSTMIYAEVLNMMISPDEYVGKTIRMDGVLSIYHDPMQDKDYFTCIVQDATACCAQGIEFVWKGEHSYPDDYPELDTEIEVAGTYEKYEEDGYAYYHLAEASLESI